MSERKCGGCTACCIVLGVTELAKPDYCDCKHRTFAGCSIYSRRPPNCRNFECGWLLGIGDDEHRPDRSGVMIYARPENIEKGIVQIHEVRLGAATTGPGADIVRACLTQNLIVLIIRDGGQRSALFPPGREPEGPISIVDSED